MRRYRGDARIAFRVNGEERSAVVQPGETLLDMLRERLGLFGAKRGCENGDCGACTVLLGGRPVKACLVPAVEADGAVVLTVEGLRDERLRQAFLEQGGVQCGFCTAGFLVNAFALLQAHPDPGDEEIGQAVIVAVEHRHAAADEMLPSAVVDMGAGQTVAAVDEQRSGGGGAGKQGEAGSPERFHCAAT